MKINSKQISPASSCYIIAEISHNHQGRESDVLSIIKAAAKNGANAVKFQKRDNTSLFLPDFYNKDYNNENSFGKTYGEHREFLEPKVSWLKKANALAHSLKLDFIMTVFDEASLILCEKELSIDAYKIQSADLTNHILIKKIAQIGKPYFISCGASSLNEIKKSYTCCKALKTPFCLMYAVSQYPTSDLNVNLNRILQMKQLLKTDQIGFSCHHQSIEPAVIARTLGVVAIEKHFTLNKEQKGPDHKLSITPSELNNLRKRLDQTDVFIGNRWQKTTSIESYQQDARFKMGKCAVAAKDLKKGSILKEKDLLFKSPMMGFNCMEVQKFIGKPLGKDIKQGTIIG